MSRKIKVCFWVILMFLVINCGSVFAINLNQLNNLLKVYNVWSISEQNKIKIVNYSNEYKYFIIGQAGNDNNNLLYIFTNLEPKYYESASWYTSFLVKDPNGIYYESNIQGFRSYPNTYVRLVKDNYYYTKTILYDNNGNLVIPAGENKEIMGQDYTKPYFEYAINKIGTTTINNNKIDTFYKTDFELWTNQYSTNKLIGYLYIDKNYILDDIFMPVLNINQSNLSQTQSWSYKRISVF